MVPFLKAVAAAYIKRYADMSRFTFVFPNKRSGTFFRKYLQEEMSSRPMLSPEITTVSDFVAKLSGSTVDSRIDLLLTLYDSYRQLLKNNGAEENEFSDFDSFRSWGDVVLSDFNDVDMFAVDASRLFKNVRDFKEIETDYLTDEQRAVMEEYFGVTDARHDFENFWKSYDYKSGRDEKRETEVKRRFLMLWEVLWPLYEDFNRRLEERGLTYTGGAYRKALRRLREEGTAITGADKVVFVGFNALTRIEWLIFNLLRRSRTETDGREEPFADFFWDGSGPWFDDKSNSAVKFIDRDRKHFPSPAWADLDASLVGGHIPEIRVISAPSNAVQAKIAGALVGGLTESGKEKAEIDKANVAVVLPDENLLLPMLYSLPDSISDINLTMGFPLRLTSAASFVSLLRRLQGRKRKVSGEWMYMSEDVKTLLSHPFLHSLEGAGPILRLKTRIRKLRRFFLSPGEISEYCSKSAPLFVPLEKGTGCKDAINYLDVSLGVAENALESHGGNDMDSQIKTRLDTDYIRVYRDALRRLDAAVETHGVSMEWPTLFLLADRLLAGETVSFEGEPLEGLQVMGILETRCLDFEHLIIPSMNERIFPMRMRMRSFIPDNLRKAYGMASASYQESIFSYYFYRLISRARSVALIYDSRTANLTSGDPSRYVHQLRHLYAPGKIKSEEFNFTLSNPASCNMEIIKDSLVREKIELYSVPGSGRRFSASTLQHYLSCPVRFYFENLLGISAEEEPEEGIDAIMQGNILHEAMMDVYLPSGLRGKYLESPVRIKAETIDAMLSEEGRKRLSSIVKRCMNHELYKDSERLDDELKPSHAMVAEMLCMQLCNILRRDRGYTPFDLYGCEIKENMSFRLRSGRSVNMVAAIDRIDCLDPDGANPLWRIVDYKTGAVHLTAGEPDEAAFSAFDAKHLFQLQLYANIHNEYLRQNGLGKQRSFRTVVYNVGAILSDSNKNPGVAIPVIGKDRLDTYDSLILPDEENFNDFFLDRLSDSIEDIFNMEKPFIMTADTDECAYCPIARICNR